MQLLSHGQSGRPLAGRRGVASSILDEVNHQLESRMREIRLSGSEGGGAKPIVSPYPYQFFAPLRGFSSRYKKFVNNPGWALSTGH